jgi:pyridoxamine 5'-phosphate oxidase
VKRKPLSFATASLPKETAIVNERILTPGNLDACEDPFALFLLWFEEARASEINDPDAMSLATVDADGLPDVRMVLCKGVEPDSLVFYTNAESAKGRQIERHSQAAALFHWKSLRRQARFRGEVRMVDEAAADAYFHSRHPQSQLGAWASEQSRPLESRAFLERRVAEFTAKFGAGEIPRPPYWRGFRLTPSEVELWADGAFRLHDRVRFTRTASGWTRQRLFP